MLQPRNEDVYVEWCWARVMLVKSSFVSSWQLRFACLKLMIELGCRTEKRGYNDYRCCAGKVACSCHNVTFTDVQSQSGGDPRTGPSFGQDNVLTSSLCSCFRCETAL